MVSKSLGLGNGILKIRLATLFFVSSFNQHQYVFMEQVWASIDYVIGPCVNQDYIISSDPKCTSLYFAPGSICSSAPVTFSFKCMWSVLLMYSQSGMYF